MGDAAPRSGDESFQPRVPRQSTSAVEALAMVLASLAVFFLVAELVCRFLPVRSGLQVQAVDAAHPFISFTPDGEFVFSNGSLLTNVNRGRINNHGFVNDQDYDPGDTRPLLAVIGDSYVEAAMVPYRLTMQGRLAAAQGGERRVYSFGSSGSSLLDYVAYASLARRRFKADWLVINVVGNDFDEMLLRYKQAPGHHYYQETPGEGLRPVLIEYSPSLGRRLLRHSALARYLLLNVANASPDLSWLLDALFRVEHAITPPPAAAQVAAVGNTSADLDPLRVHLSERAVQRVLDDLASTAGIETSHVLFLVDSYRVFDDAALASARQSFFGVLRSAFIAEAQRRGYEVQDLQDWFARRHARDGSVFEFPDDGHWNAIGHEVAAEAILASRVYAEFTASAAR
jgi:hypothetical protein